MQDADHPPSLQSAESPELKRVEWGETERLSFLLYSHIGCSHIEVKMPNQDSFAIRKDGDVVFAALGDGLGSCAFAQEGSQLLTVSITEKMQQMVKMARSETVEKEQYRPLLRAWRLSLSLRTKSSEATNDLFTLDHNTFKNLFIKSVEEIREELETLSTKKKVQENSEARSCVNSQQRDLTKN